MISFKRIAFLLRHPPVVLAMGFLVLIIGGAILLKLPGFTTKPLGFLQAMFMTTSSVTVTGLAVADLSDFTLYGQLVMLFLMETGGLGFMTFTVLAIMALQRRIGMHGQLIVSQAMGGVKLSEINEIAKKIIFLALIVQSIGWFLLCVLWAGDFGWKESAYSAFFYTISAFNNAGFALTGDNLMVYSHQTTVLFIFTLLIMIGGLGFFVVTDFAKKPLGQELSVNTKVIIIATLGLNLIAATIFWLLEHKNLHTIGTMPLSEQVMNSWFAAVTPRTAGFNTIPTDQYTDASTFLTLVLMFIGAGSFSTGGGIKLGTMVVLLLTTWSFIQQRDSVTVMRRKIAEKQVKKAIAVVIVTALMIALSIFILLAIEAHHEFIDVLFEVVSAISTVGLSRGITSVLTPMGEVVIMFMMFAGRVGPLTIGYLIALPKTTKIEYPEARIDVG
ncbi:TrkH family potassium uptake protein [Suttonella ornithocola]|uniref:Ktr system potassium uptake protein B n=1 Tax=Suttonella ornithocola TaxID=279832 RepID=A0A380MS69_9GAMM|nr:potassium transporter TrkG [Suttonella ornithocola]SUO95405.1 Ktr system potassium uptake protein B [Suttonella ornithocola]